MRTFLLRFVLGSAVGCAALLSTPCAIAQRFDRGRFDPSEWYSRMDANKNGQIDPDEVSDRSRPFLEQAAKRAGLDPQTPLPISKLLEAPPSSDSGGGSTDGDRRDRGDRGERGRGEDRGRDDSRGSSSSGGSSSKSPGVPGFEADTKIAKAQGFDAPPPAATAAAAALASKYDKRVIEMLDGMLKEYDRNRDDQLDEDEMKRMKWSSDPKESDTNKDGKLSRTELAERLAKRFQSSGGSSGGSSSSGGGSSSGAPSQQSEEYQRVKKYAESLLKQNDANSNGLLEKNEWAEVRSISKDTDTNNDGIVTLDELVAKLAGYGKSSSSSTASSGGSSSPPSGGSSSSGSGSSSGSASSGRPGESSGSRYGSSSRSGSSGKPGDRKSYRTLTALERLPKGLPDWFARNDADGDGQIQMAEYTTSWTDAKAEEFAKFDLNGDGFITVSECMKAEPSKK